MTRRARRLLRHFLMAVRRWWWMLTASRIERLVFRYQDAYGIAVSCLPNVRVADAMDSLRGIINPFLPLAEHDPRDLTAAIETLKRATAGQPLTGNAWNPAEAGR